MFAVSLSVQHGTRFSQGNQASSQVHAGAVHITAVSQDLAPDEGDAGVRQLRVGTNLFGQTQANSCDSVRGFGEEENFVTESLNNATAQGAITSRQLCSKWLMS